MCFVQKSLYKDQVEMMLVSHVFNEFQSHVPFLRARACWMLQQFSEVPFKLVSNLQRLVELLARSLCEDKELPVRVEAALAIQHVLSDQKQGALATLCYICGSKISYILIEE